MAERMKGEEKAEKLFYRLEEVSRISGLEAKVIERWEREFPFLHAGQTGSGQKIFRARDLNIILRLKELLIQEKLTLAGAKRRIEEEFSDKASGPIHPDRLKKALFEVREQLQEIVSSLEKKSRKL
ncbi:MAG: MerR family transcriptional regulator [Candidatus Aminicenantales bacterium]